LRAKLARFFNSLLQCKAEYTDIYNNRYRPQGNIFGGHNFFNNLLKLFYGDYIPEELEQEILPSPQEDP